jgi:apolipoprotein N-acyltransferase
MLTSLSLPPYNYLLINFFTFTLLFLYLIKKSNQHKNLRLYFIYGWLFGFGYFVTNLYWIAISLTFDENFKFLIPFAVFLIPAFLALFYGLVSYFFLTFKPKKLLSSFLFFSLIFGILEFIRGFILTGFPWNLIAYSFSNQLKILSITSVIGTYGFNLFCISLFTSPAIFILRDTKKDIVALIFFLMMPILFYIHGSLYEKKFNTLNVKTYDYKIRTIGSNISLDRFYSNNNPISVIKDLIRISNPNINEKIIFVWPEGIFPNISQEKLVEYKWLFDNYFNDNHLLITGINSQSIIDGSLNHFNTFSVYDSNLDLLSSYNKINLVPFGEFLPLEGILRSVGFKTITNNYQSFSSGKKRNIIEIKQKNSNLKILPLICYEIIYSGKIFDDKDFNLIINISEDGWFGKSIGPKQHFIHSIFRAIESRKYILRSANNGVAAIINPLGVVEKKVDFGKSGYIDFNESRITQPTIFSIYGNKIFFIIILLYIFLIFLSNKIKL